MGDLHFHYWLLWLRQLIFVVALGIDPTVELAAVRLCSQLLRLLVASDNRSIQERALPVHGC